MVTVNHSACFFWYVFHRQSLVVSGFLGTEGHVQVTSYCLFSTRVMVNQKRRVTAKAKQLVRGYGQLYFAPVSVCTASYTCLGSDSFTLRGWRDRGDLKAERRIISKRCMVEYIQLPIFRSSFKFCMGDKLREKMEGGKRDETFFSAL